MAQKIEDKTEENREESFEVIELAIDKLDLLTRAFDLISEACGEPRAKIEEFPCGIPEELLN